MNLRPLVPDATFVDRLLAWFTGAMRPLPWREDYVPYHVWISEIMLQQTQMERGVRYYREWLRRFPDVQAVARAEEDAVLAAWEGLGYYSRARNLHAAAKRIVTEHGGIFPSDPEAIRALPGVGDYTAGAIAAIAFNLPVPAVDANVLRIFARLQDIDAPVSSAAVKTRVTEAVRSLLPLAPPRQLCQALMEFGALVCGKVARCQVCPVTDYCGALACGTVSVRPRKGAKAVIRTVESVAGIVVRQGLVLIRKRPLGGLWGGLWEFPGGEIPAGEERETVLGRLLLEEMGLIATDRRATPPARHGYTTNKAVVYGYLCETEMAADSGSYPGEVRWVRPEELAEYSFHAGHRKLMERLGWKQAGDAVSRPRAVRQ